MKLTKSFWNGLIVILTFVLFYFMVQYLKNDLTGQSTYNFVVLFESVQGLNEGDNVNMLGKKIGKVNSTNITGQKVQVRLSIDRTYINMIPIDSEIEVTSDGLMGSKYVSIKPGLSTKKMISDGDLVEGKREYDYTMITGDIQPLTQDLAAFARALRATLGESEKDNIRSSLENIKSATAQIDTVVIGNLVGTIDNIIDDLNDMSDDVGSFVKDSKVAIRSVSSISSDFSNSLKEFNNSISKLNYIVDKLNSDKGTIGKLINNQSLYNSMDKLVSDINGIVLDVKENPKKYKDHLKVYLRAQKEIKREQ